MVLSRCPRVCSVKEIIKTQDLLTTVGRAVLTVILVAVQIEEGTKT